MVFPVLTVLITIAECDLDVFLYYKFLNKNLSCEFLHPNVLLIVVKQQIYHFDTKIKIIRLQTIRLEILKQKRLDD